MSHKRSKSLVPIVTWLIVAGVFPPPVLKSQTTPSSEVRQLLLAMKGSHGSTKQLGVLFAQGDNKISDLIMALSDSDQDVKLSAQIVIRYLGNDVGITAWASKYKGDKDQALTGPLPIPLREVDYEFIKSTYLRKNILTEALLDACLFALALDGTPRATQLLSAVIKNVNENGFNLRESRYLEVRSVSIRTEADLANAVLEQSTFIDSEDRRRFAKVRLLAYNAAKDKALIEIYINRGPLAEEWWHIVLSEHELGWRFFSITQVAVS